MGACGCPGHRGVGETTGDTIFPSSDDDDWEIGAGETERLKSPSGAWSIGVDYDTVELILFHRGAAMAVISRNSTGGWGGGGTSKAVLNARTAQLELWRGESCACDYKSVLAWSSPRPSSPDTDIRGLTLVLQNDGALVLRNRRAEVLWFWTR